MNALPSLVVYNKIECRYCGQSSWANVLCCQFCGAPLAPIAPQTKPLISHEIPAFFVREYDIHRRAYIFRIRFKNGEVRETWIADEEIKRASLSGYFMRDTEQRILYNLGLADDRVNRNNDFIEWFWNGG